MIKQIKKISLCVLAFIITFVFAFISVSNAEIYAADSEEETVLSDYATRVGELETQNLMGGVTLYKERVKTIYNGVDTGINDPNNKNYRYSHNTVQWVDLPKTSEDVKIVVWSEGTANGWASSTVRNTARHYEETHPGWIVVAAVNGDGFDINGTKQPNNIHVQEGDVLQTNISPIQIGWEADNTPKFGNSATLSKQMMVQIMNGSKVVEELPVAAVNTTPSATGITVLTKDMAEAVDLTGYTVYVGKYDLCRISKHTKLPFVKGTIESITSELGVDKPNETEEYKNVREFYLVSKDGSLEGKVSEGTYVRCQYPITGEWAEIDNIISGFGSHAGATYQAQVLDNGKVIGAGSTDTFVNTTHPRTIVGFKEDGSTVLMVADGRGKLDDYEQGLSYFQEGEMMRLAGCVNAFNLDGGGSSTLIVKNAYGDFDVINRPSDGGERSIGNAILFVMRDPGITWDIKNTTRNDVVFKLNENALAQDVEVTIDGKTAKMENGVARVSGLKEETTYTATISYKIPDAEDPSILLSGSYKVDVTTKAFKMPSSGVRFINVNKNSVSVDRPDSDTSSWISNIVISLNDEVYNLGTGKSLEIDGLLEDTPYKATITYDVTDPKSGNVYHGEEILSFQTLTYSLPMIKVFEVYRQTANRITFKYEYYDPDKLVEYAKIYCNKDEYELTTKTGTFTISDLDFEGNSYTFYMLIAYDGGGLNLKTAKSEKIEINSTVVKHSIEYVLDGGTLPTGAPSSYEEGVGLDKLPTPTKDGYEFTGWELNGVIVNSISASEKGDIELVATWEEVEDGGGNDTGDDNQGGGSSCQMGASIKAIFTLSAMLSLLIVVLRKKK